MDYNRDLNSTPSSDAIDRLTKMHDENRKRHMKLGKIKKSKLKCLDLKF